jgi:hypothetical protein
MQIEVMASCTKQVVANSEQGKEVETISNNIKIESIHGKALLCM